MHKFVLGAWTQWPKMPGCVLIRRINRPYFCALCEFAHLEHTQYYVPVEDLPALEMALNALRDQIEAENLWHDAKMNPPKIPGLYYGKKDDTNSMWLCKYRDGTWVLDSYPEQQMDIIWWAEYTAYAFTH